MKPYKKIMSKEIERGISQKGFYEAIIFYNAVEVEYKDKETGDFTSEFPEKVKATNMYTCLKGIREKVRAKSFKDLEYIGKNDFDKNSVELRHSYYADDHNYPVSKRDYELWKKGLKTLWKFNCRIILTKSENEKVSIEQLADYGIKIK